MFRRKCKNCRMNLSIHSELRIDNNPIGYQCKSCFSFHSWVTGQLIKKEVKKDSKEN